jgi:hypothetical protein
MFEAILDHTDEDMSMYPAWLYLTVSNSCGRLEQFADSIMFTMQLP